MEKFITTIGKGEVMRVYEFAKELGKDSGDFLHELNGSSGFKIKSHLSSITEEQIQKVRDTYDKKDASPKISDMIGKDDEAELHHKEALKETFNVDKSIKTHVETSKSAREQYAKTVQKITNDPKEWSNINTKKQEVIVEKPGWLAKLFSWWTGT